MLPSRILVKGKNRNFPKIVLHPKCRAWLDRSAAHLSGLSPQQRAAWFREWIPAARRFPLRDGMSAFDLHVVITTLLNWQAEQTREAA